MEIKRVLLNKKTIISFLLIVILGVGFFINSQFHIEKYNNYSIKEINSYRQKYIDELKNLPNDSISDAVWEKLSFVNTICDLIDFEKIKIDNYDEYLELWSENEKSIRLKNPSASDFYDKNKKYISASDYHLKQIVLENISGQVEYINGFDSYLQSITNKADNMNSVSIFKTDDDEVDENIEQTVEDYNHLKNIELNIGIDEPIESVVNSPVIGYLLAIFSLFIIFICFEERKKGLWCLVRSSQKGRTILAMKRTGILAVSVILSTTIMYGVMFLSSFTIYGGVEDLFRNIQSIPSFKNFVFPMTELEFILLFILINIITQLVVAFILNFVFTVIQNISLAIGVTGIIFAGELLIYNYLPFQNFLSFFKCVNLLYYINPYDPITKYRNIETFGIIINFLYLLLFSAIILAVIFIVLSIIISTKKYPVKSPSKAEILINRFLNRIKKIYWCGVEKFTVIGYEIYKLLIVQKGILVLAVFVFILLSSVSTDRIYYSNTDSMVNKFYTQYSGEITDKTREYVNVLESEIAEVDNEFACAVNDYKNNRISKEEYENKSMKSEVYEFKREALNIIKERIKYADDNNVWLVNPNGYESLLGERGYNRQENYVLLSVFCIIIIMSGLFAYENKSSMHNMIMASYRGREYLFKKKMLTAIILTIIIWLFISVAELYDVLSKYTITDFSAPVKSLIFLNELPFNMPIWIYISSIYFARLVLLLSVTYIVCAFSTAAKFEICMIASIIILIIPSVLNIIGISFFKYLSVSVPIALTEMINNSSHYIFIIPILLITAIGTLCIYISKKRWCRNGT